MVEKRYGQGPDRRDARRGAARRGADFELNVSAIAEGALEAAVKAERARRWYAENAEAIEQRNRRIEEHGPILADVAIWKP